ncbi:hypothetical protein HFC70_19935 [Agrobacterium sp. a22-2]|uniref:MAPEG family protein n=1 Tax=Agrobacterium sp. a22-2 TaxID=2283840 RepID=UPI0014451365|nr:MAPEG family protein [Agrobacterium sp. a22-2]NKN38626.1 hypothetical protein [Agrobacterium sp. a22-2]
MTGFGLFWPLVVHAFLVFCLYGLLTLRRASVVKSGLVEREAFRDNRDEPAESRVVNRAIANQFELPVLFYAVSILLYIVDADNVVAVALAWLFVVTRCAHAFVHVTGNRLKLRRPLFMAGFVALFAMWIWLAAWMAVS